MSNSLKVKLITTPTYHLWNDALHARKLARQTKDEWMKGTYVRWCIITAWAVFELCCQDALNSSQITKNKINKLLNKNNCKEIDWNTGIWKQVDEIREKRVYYIHHNYEQIDLWPDISLAENAISIIREASKAIYSRCDLKCPFPLDDDNNEGWEQGKEIE